jgi:acetoacetate decarboxylase
LYNASTSVECSWKTITDKVLEALTSPDVLNKIIPILSEKICETIEATIKDVVDDKIKTHVDAHVNPSIETVSMCIVGHYILVLQAALQVRFGIW